MFALIPLAANECWPACHSPWGPSREAGEKRRGGGGGVRGTWRIGLREQPQGLKFPTPGVVLLFGLHLASAASHGGAPAIQ